LILNGHHVSILKMFHAIILGSCVCLLGYYGITGYTTSVYGIMQNNRRDIRHINNKVSQMSDIMTQQYLDHSTKLDEMNKNFMGKFNKLDEMNKDFTDKFNKLNINIELVHNDVSDTKILTKDIHAIMLQFSKGNLLDEPPPAADNSKPLTKRILSAIGL